MKEPHHFNHYNKRLRGLAHSNRYKMTKAEACLWKYALRKKQMHGYSFNRQRPIDTYIADFFCKSLKLVIEVDGVSHFHEEVKRKDAQKQAELEHLGYTLIRFTDAEVLNNMNEVRRIIEETVKRLEKNPPS